jgi:diguanylate cyclase (GGDEF)-like protein
MISLRSRPVAGISAVLILALCVLFLSGLSADRQSPESPSRPSLIVAAVFAFNVPILLAWIAFGVTGGIAALIFSSISVIFFDLKMGLYSYHILILPFFITSYTGNRFLRIRGEIDQSSLMRTEDTEGEINILENALKEKSGSMQSVEDKLVRYSLLKGVSESLSTVLSKEAVNGLIIDQTDRTIGKSGRIMLYLVDTNTHELTLAAAKEDHKIMAKKGDPFDQWVLRNRRSLIVEDVSRDFRFSTGDIEEAKVNFRSLISQPLIVESRVVGVLRTDSPGAFGYTQDDLRLLGIISDLGAVAVQNSCLYSRAQELAIRDGLTGLAVRRYFTERFHHELRRAARKKEDISLLMIDIDHFKDYNDKYGHAAGDLVLKYMADMLTAAADEADVVGRYGGEELVVLLCGKSKREAFAEAESMRLSVKEHPMTLRGRRAGLTVSIGVATYPEDAASEEELIRIADGRLYKAKTKGRDRVCSD